MKQLVSTLDSTNLNIFSVKECLKLIGIKELTANIYALPKSKKPKKDLVSVEN